MDIKQLKIIVEAALLATDEPLDNKQLLQLFPEQELSGNDINQAIIELQKDYQGRGVELKQLAGGYRLQTTQNMQPWLQKLWQQKPKKLSRALLETLALIAYRQPITRGEIEDVRGVAVSAKIIHYLMEQEWIKILGYRDTPGKPAMLGTTKTFLDYFNLSSLQELPSLAAIKDIDDLEPQLDLAPKNFQTNNENHTQAQEKNHD